MLARMMDQPFAVGDAHVFLEDGGAALPVAVTPTFWRELITGENRSHGVRQIAESTGWLVCALPKKEDDRGWEMHPAGDEILYMMSGAVDVVLEYDNVKRLIPLHEGTACVVPRGTWHRTITRAPGDMLAITYGKGTQHRPLGG